MAYDAVLAERVRRLLHGRKGVTESIMFGGVVYLLNGYMCCGIRDQLLLLQLGEAGVARALKKRLRVSLPSNSTTCGYH